MKDYPINKRWPWDIAEPVRPYAYKNGGDFPKISIITPSFNQGHFIEETIRSVILQDYPNLEYIIIDGGSSDNTIQIIEKYAKYIDYWVSEPDRGQSHAINKGFEKCTGDYINWICSDDVLCKDALKNISPLLKADKDILLLGKGYRIDKESNIIDEILPSNIDNFEKLINLRQFWRKGNSILQQSTFYPFTALKKAGYLNEKNYYTMDFELWGKMLMNEIKVVQTNIPVGMFRWYPGQKTSNQMEVTRSLTNTARRLVLTNNNSSQRLKILQLKMIIEYKIFFLYKNLRSKIGIKRRFKALLHG